MINNLNNNKTKGTILLIHGFLGSSLNMQPLKEFLLTNGYSVISFDLPGHGNDYLNFNNTDKDKWLKKVEEEFDKIKEESNISIIGFSMGANLAILLFNKIKDKLNTNIRLILLAPAFSVNTKFFPSFFKVLIGLVINKNFKLKFQNPGCNDPFYKKYYIQKVEYISPQKFWDLYFLIIKSKLIIRKLSLPILFIHSKKDILSPYKNSYKIYIKLKNRYKYLLALNRSNHFIQLDLERVIVYKTIIQFIEKT